MNQDETVRSRSALKEKKRYQSSRDEIGRGHLEKRSDWTRTWQKRYFVYGAGELKYYIDRSDAKPKIFPYIGKWNILVSF